MNTVSKRSMPITLFVFVAVLAQAIRFFDEISNQLPYGLLHFTAK